MAPSLAARRTSRGQALVEYIMIIGLIVIFIITALFYFRDAVNAFTGQIGEWIGGVSASATPPPSIAAAPRPAPAPVSPAAPSTPPPPAAQPAPSPAGMTDDDWATRLEGYWCHPVNNIYVQRIGPGMVTVTRVYPDGRRDTPQPLRITSLGENEWRASDAGGYEDSELTSENTFRLSGQNGVPLSPARPIIFTRCYGPTS